MLLSQLYVYIKHHVIVVKKTVRRLRLQLKGCQAFKKQLLHSLFQTHLKKNFSLFKTYYGVKDGHQSDVIVYTWQCKRC